LVEGFLNEFPVFVKCVSSTHFIGSPLVEHTLPLGLGFWIFRLDLGEDLNSRLEVVLLDVLSVGFHGLNPVSQINERSLEFGDQRFLEVGFSSLVDHNLDGGDHVSCLREYEAHVFGCALECIEGKRCCFLRFCDQDAIDG